MPIVIKLEHADYCADCDLIFDARNQRYCPKCAGSAVMPLLRMGFNMTLKQVRDDVVTIKLEAA